MTGCNGDTGLRPGYATGVTEKNRPQTGKYASLSIKVTPNGSYACTHTHTRPRAGARGLEAQASKKGVTALPAVQHGENAETRGVTGVTTAPTRQKPASEPARTGLFGVTGGRSMATRTAIRQALHFSLGLPFTQVARLTGSDPSTVRKQIVRGRHWARRSESERTEAIAAARVLVEGEA